MNKIRVGYFVNSSSNKMQFMGPRNVPSNHDHVKFWYLDNKNFCPIPLYKKVPQDIESFIFLRLIFIVISTLIISDSSGNNR